MSAFSGRVDVAGSRGEEPRALHGEAPDAYVVRCAVAKLGTGPFDSKFGLSRKRGYRRGAGRRQS